jgi:hypothetical protein
MWFSRMVLGSAAAQDFFFGRFSAALRYRLLKIRDTLTPRAQMTMREGICRGADGNDRLLGFRGE